MEALLYYLAVMGQVNRDEIAGILWGDKENQVARKTYGIRFTKPIKFLKEISLSLQVGAVWPLNPDLSLSLDVQLLKEIH